MADIVVRSPVAGTVWKIEAAVGDALAADAEIMILESMKMEVPVTAPEGGTLVELLVDEEEVIAEGQDVAVIRP
jgi:biotin carboxyl carrier protein